MGNKLLELFGFFVVVVVGVGGVKIVVPLFIGVFVDGLFVDGLFVDGGIIGDLVVLVVDGVVVMAVNSYVLQAPYLVTSHKEHLLLFLTQSLISAYVVIHPRFVVAPFYM